MPQCSVALLPPAPQVVPTRKVRSKKKGGAAAAPAAGGGAAAAAGGEEEEDEEEGGALNPDDLLPRTDISGSITPALLSMISSSNWKERNAGVDQVRRSRGSVWLAWARAGRMGNVGALYFALHQTLACPLMLMVLLSGNPCCCAQVIQLLAEAAGRIQPSVGELFAALKASRVSSVGFTRCWLDRKAGGLVSARSTPAST